jgi:hypothetical protein
MPEKYALSAQAQQEEINLIGKPLFQRGRSSRFEASSMPSPPYSGMLSPANVKK